MPVLEPNPPNGQKKFLLVLAAMFATMAVVAVIATIISP
jgi:hypothetical protein